ncbi:MAG TPA: hypothetical protein VFZ55_00255, partial [Nitrososphaera sp.]
DDWKEKVKKHAKGGSGGDGGDSSADAAVGIDQDVSNDAVTVQDSSATGNTLSNTNEFGDDIAVVDQDNLADQDALNLGFQDQDATQDQDADQDATQEDINFQYGFSQQADDFGVNLNDLGLDLTL